MRSRRWLGQAGLAAGIFASSSCIVAAELTVRVQDQAGVAVEDAVVYVEAASPSKLKKQATVNIEQRQRQFNPQVSVIQTGSHIRFPNMDKVRHHVYSFSPAKVFELKLYADAPSEPVIFDRAGTVVIGCNIHDKMVAYVHIVNTPHFAKSDKDGNSVITDLVPGNYTLKVWHADLPVNSAVFEKNFTVKDRDATTVQLNLQRSPLTTPP